MKIKWSKTAIQTNPQWNIWKAQWDQYIRICSDQLSVSFIDITRLQARAMFGAASVFITASLPLPDGREVIRQMWRGRLSLYQSCVGVIINFLAPSHFLGARCVYRTPALWPVRALISVTWLPTLQSPAGKPRRAVGVFGIFSLISWEAERGLRTWFLISSFPPPS